MEHHTVAYDPVKAWDGGDQVPFKASYGKLMMWYFLLSDAFTFSGFLIAYGALRFSVPTWPEPDFVFRALPGGIENAPLIFVTFMTFVLIVSSVTMVRAVQEGQQENKNGVAFWMFLTILGGATFLGCQAWEWTHLMHEGVSLYTDPFCRMDDGTPYLAHWDEAKAMWLDPNGGQAVLGPRAFGALFFCITGFHGFHVFSGVVFLIIILVNVLSGIYVERRNGYEMVEKMGLYWHFVDLVWVFVFLVFYLI